MKKQIKILSLLSALAVSALFFTGCGGNGNNHSSSTMSMPWESQTTSQQTSSELPPIVEPSTIKPSGQPSISETTVTPGRYDNSQITSTTSVPLESQTTSQQTSSELPPIVEPSTIKPSGQPSISEPTVTPVGKKSIKEALEADIGIEGVVQTFAKAYETDDMKLTGAYSGDDTIVFYMTLTKYVDPNSEQTRTNVASVAAQLETLNESMAQAILAIETQYNSNPFAMEFQICNADGTVLFTKTFTDQS